MDGLQFFAGIMLVFAGWLTIRRALPHSSYGRNEESPWLGWNILGLTQIAMAVALIRFA